MASAKEHDKKAEKVIEKTVDQPWFSLILEGKKKIEGRSGNGDQYKINDIIQFNNAVSKDQTNEKVVNSVRVKITRVDNYKTLRELVVNCGAKNLMPREDILKMHDDVATEKVMDLYCDIYEKVKGLWFNNKMTLDDRAEHIFKDEGLCAIHFELIG